MSSAHQEVVKLPHRKMTFASISCLLAAHGVEARALCIIQLGIEVVERDLYGGRGVIHGRELIVGGVEPGDRVGGTGCAQEAITSLAMSSEALCRFAKLAA